jgi:methylmalonyl-CoA/ethylmalonyl-CoA epimerase
MGHATVLVYQFPLFRHLEGLVPNTKLCTASFVIQHSYFIIRHSPMPYFYKKSYMLNVEHIGIAVKSLNDSVPLFEKLLNSTCYKTEAVAGERVNTAFFKQGGTKIELLESTEADGVIAKFIEKKGEGIHHIAFEVADIEAEMARLQQEGFVLLNERPKAGADNKLVCFLHPKGTNGVLVELCMSIG